MNTGLSHHEEKDLENMSEYASLRCGNDWVKVGDAEIPEHETVLVKIGDNTILCGICDSYGQWYVYYSDGRKPAYPDRPVTHWMPLPSPPKH